MALVKKYFTSNGSWVAPSGVTNVIIIAAGGGGGGAGGIVTTTYSGGGGGGSWQVTSIITVVPNTSYTITIGAGGAGGAATAPGANGSSTTFGSLLTANGAGYGIGQSNTSAGGSPIACNPYSQYTSGGSYWTTELPGAGGQHFGIGIFPYDGMPNPNGFMGKTFGAASGAYNGGGGGGGGPNGVGGSAGTGNNAGTGGAGTAGAANSGAGGGGGGCGSSAGGAGGAGGSGYLYVIWDS